ncbi:hypothetical protein KFL_001380150 [Klebsormidium nitens]|uniref:Germin-like protein n=1 Tax=Klebsormidium nitens TaxID=105231 RepID=A0A1Y1HYD1_KLENI|nr:hypothetical protein KFL_001380150 [Klebsormidium nitens]|eukprot:GAQ83173.1 hypothetical protein KFL_001380150 [Klebsormidium nitens]
MAALKGVSVALFALFGGALVGFAAAADPDPLVDFVPVDALGDAQFKFALGNSTGIVGPGGQIQPANVINFPALTSQGQSLVRFNLRPCGQNPPHTHPRASEVIFLISGGPLLVGFVDTTGIPHLNALMPGDVTVFPRGLVHFQQNFGTENAIYIAGLNSQNPGVQPMFTALGAFPAPVLATALNTSVANLTLTALPKNGAPPLGSAASGCVPGSLPPGIRV